MKRIERSIFLVLIALPLLLTTSNAFETIPPDVTQAATDGMERFLKAIPEDHLEHYGFESASELDKAYLGTPFKLYTIDPTEIISFDKGGDISKIISPTNMWLFPVVCAGTSRTLLTVDFFKGAWKAVDLGASHLASEMDFVSDYLATFQDYDIRFVRIFQASSEFLLLSKEEASVVVPLKSTAMIMGLASASEPYDYRKTVDPYEVLNELAPVVEKNLGIE